MKWKALTFEDVVVGFVYGIRYSQSHLLHLYLIVPAGLVVIFSALYGINVFIEKILKINFPASVLGMLINLVLLCVLNFVANMQFKSNVGKHIAHGADICFTTWLKLIRAPMNFSLKWINVFFIPSFVILPLSDPITFIECLKIAAVFIIGGLALIMIDVYMIVAIQWLMKSMGWLATHPADSQKDLSDEEDIELTQLHSHSGGVFTTMRDDITTIDLDTSSSSPLAKNTREIPASENPFSTDASNTPVSELVNPEPAYLGTKSGAPPSIAQVSISQGSGHQRSASNVSIPSQESNKSTRFPDKNFNENMQQIIIFTTKYIDWILYAILFVVSLPLYYVSSIHTFLPYHLGLTILAYYAALLIPQRWPQTKKIAHPILVAVGQILFVCFIGLLIYHHGKPKGFLDDLRYYKTGKNYLNLFNKKELAQSGKIIGGVPGDKTGTPQWPGCGDVLSSLMDVSIVALLLPMFTHRKDFVHNFWVIMPPVLASMSLTYFCYPLVCYHIGISGERSIGFIGRSVTLALGTPLITTLGGSVSLMACCTIMSGICGVLVGDLIFKFLRVKPNDYVTRGVTLGINCGAIATAHLLNVDPRAALMSSLSFSIFGTIMIILSSINVVKDMIQSWVQL